METITTIGLGRRLANSAVGNPTNPQTEASVKEIQSMPRTPDGCQSPSDPRLKQLQP
jgi:hypothetical protein